jgi:hypothetical protein
VVPYHTPPLRQVSEVRKRGRGTVPHPPSQAGFGGKETGPWYRTTPPFSGRFRRSGNGAVVPYHTPPAPTAVALSTGALPVPRYRLLLPLAAST